MPGPTLEAVECAGSGVVGFAAEGEVPKCRPWHEVFALHHENSQRISRIDLTAVENRRALIEVSSVALNLQFDITSNILPVETASETARELDASRSAGARI